MGLLGKYVRHSRAPVASHLGFAALGEGFLARTRLPQRPLWPSGTSLQTDGLGRVSLVDRWFKH